MMFTYIIVSTVLLLHLDMLLTVHCIGRILSVHPCIYKLVCSLRSRSGLVHKPHHCNNKNLKNVLRVSKILKSLIVMK